MFTSRYLTTKAKQPLKKPSFWEKTDYSYKDIAMDFHQVEIDKKAVELCGDKAGSDGYLGCYQMAYNVIEKELSEETRIKYRADAKKWSTQLPPPLVQRWYVHTNYSS